MKLIIKLLVLFFAIQKLHAKAIDEEQMIKIGNLALPSSQEPGPLLGFGQNIIDKGDLIAYVFPDCLFGCRKKFFGVAPSVLYAIRDDLSIFLEWSVAAQFKLDGLRSSGSEDFLAQLEYCLYLQETERSANQVTMVTSVFLPLGRDDTLAPATGFGSVSFFLGFTASHLSTDWYYYVSPAVILTTKHGCNTKSGNQFIYQAGFGKNIAYKTDKWILTWMIELSGLYAQKSKFNGIIDHNSGGNFILLGPSLWFSTKRLVLQAGIAPVISEHLFGKQLKNRFYVAFNVGWKF